MNSTNVLILQKAEKLFIEKGVVKTSIHEIAKACKLVVASLYHYYPNKEEILSAILVKKLEENRRQLTEHLAGISDPISKLEKYIWFQFYFCEKDPGYSKLILLELRHHKNLDQISPYQYMKQLVNELVPILREGQQQGIFQKDIDTITFRNMIWGTLEAFTRNWLIFGRPEKITDYAPVVTRRLLLSILTPGARRDVALLLPGRPKAKDPGGKTRSKV
jgi:AcrR family transcriptional regulator